jgi:hypothetical protein
MVGIVAYSETHRPRAEGRLWSLDAVPEGDRFTAWREIVSETHLPFAMELTSGLPSEDFSAEVPRTALR